MKANIQENTDILLTAINDFTAFKNELLKSIPEKVEANLSQKHEALLEKFYKQRILLHSLACIFHCFRHMLHCSLLVPQCAARRQSEGSGAAKERLSGVRKLGTLHEREKSQFVEEVGKRRDQVHSGSRQAAVRTIKPHRLAAEMLVCLWGIPIYVCIPFPSAFCSRFR